MAHRIKICAGTNVDIAITCSPEGCPGGSPAITKEVGGSLSPIWNGSCIGGRRRKPERAGIPRNG